MLCMIYHKSNIVIFIYLFTGDTTFLKDYISAFMPFNKGIFLLLISLLQI
jgi:hypothetical protein